MMYSAGLRVGELLTLKVSDIDKDRMLIKVRQAKGNKDRFTILSETMLHDLRAYYKVYRTKEYLFEGPGGKAYVPPGWNRFWATFDGAYGGKNGHGYRAVLESGLVREYFIHFNDSHYSTDVTAKEMRKFIWESVSQEKPFFAYWAPFAPHIQVKTLLPVPAEGSSPGKVDTG